MQLFTDGDETGGARSTAGGEVEAVAAAAARVRPAVPVEHPAEIARKGGATAEGQGTYASAEKEEIGTGNIFRPA